MSDYWGDVHVFGLNNHMTLSLNTEIKKLVIQMILGLITFKMGKAFFIEIVLSNYA